MDPKVYIFFFMVFLSVVLADFMHTYKFGDSRMIQENFDVHLTAHQNGKTTQTVHYNHDNFSTKNKKSIPRRSSQKRSSKKSKKSRNRKRKARTTPEPENTNIYKSDVILSKNHNNVITKHHQIPETLRRRSEPVFNRHTDNSNIEITNTGLANNGQDISMAPLKPDLRNKKKFDKKYRPEFEYVNLDTDTKKYNSRNPKTDIPDNAEAVLDESDEEYMKVLPPKIQKPNPRKGTEFIVHYDNFEDPKSDANVEDEKLKESGQFSQERRDQQEIIKLKANNIEIIDNPATSQRKYNPIFQYSNYHDKRRFPDDYSDVVDSGADVIEITTTTKAPETTFGNTEIIYLSPNPDNKKYKPIFKYQIVASEPYNYDMLNHHKPKYASDDSNSEPEETNNNDKIIVDLGDNDSDEDTGKHISEENESKSEENLKEKQDSDRDNKFIKISRKIRARDRPILHVKKYYKKVIHENIKEPENIKQHASFEQQDNIDEQRRRIKRPHTRNFVKVEKVVDDLDE